MRNTLNRTFEFMYFYYLCKLRKFVLRNFGSQKVVKRLQIKRFLSMTVLWRYSKLKMQKLLHINIF